MGIFFPIKILISLFYTEENTFLVCLWLLFLIICSSIFRNICYPQVRPLLLFLWVHYDLLPVHLQTSQSWEACSQMTFYPLLIVLAGASISFLPLIASFSHFGWLHVWLGQGTWSDLVSSRASPQICMREAWPDLHHLGPALIRYSSVWLCSSRVDPDHVLLPGPLCFQSIS